MANLFLLSFLASFYLSPVAWAERKPIKVLDMSSSGQTLMITAGERDGLKLKEAVLVRKEDKKLVAARVIRLFPEKSAVYVVSRYSRESPVRGASSQKYNILYGIPLDVPELPANFNDIATDDLENNPQDETFFAEEGKEREPEIDDDVYTPETTIKPEFPPVNYRKTHALSLGIGYFRNANLSQTLNPSSTDTKSTTTYQGYFFRYSYNFDTYFWIRKKIPALLTLEPSIGRYTFDFNDLIISRKTQIAVIALAVYLRYNYEFNPMFMGGVYLGYQNNYVSAENNYPLDRLRDLSGGGIAFGVGGSLVVSKLFDFRLDIGNDGAFFATSVKF